MALAGGPYPRGTVSARWCLGRSHGEIQIYAPTAPGVFFELMKNESSHEGPDYPPHPRLYPARAGGLPSSTSTPLSYALSF